MGSALEPDTLDDVKVHAGFRAARWIATVCYLACLGFALAWAIVERGLPFPIATLLMTMSYSLLMLLLWLYERYPPSTRQCPPPQATMALLSAMMVAVVSGL